MITTWELESVDDSPKKKKRPGSSEVRRTYLNERSENVKATHVKATHAPPRGQGQGGGWQ